MRVRVSNSTGICWDMGADFAEPLQVLVASNVCIFSRAREPGSPVFIPNGLLTLFA